MNGKPAAQVPGAQHRQFQILLVVFRHRQIVLMHVQAKGIRIPFRVLIEPFNNIRPKRTVHQGMTDSGDRTAMAVDVVSALDRIAFHLL